MIINFIRKHFNNHTLIYKSLRKVYRTLLIIYKKLKKMFLNFLLPNKFSINLKKGFDQNYFKLHKYHSKKDYILKQIEKTSLRIHRSNSFTWTDENTISKISDYLIKLDLKKGICHGVRTGLEVKWFNKNNSFDVIGTDIDPLASKNQGIINWNFEEENKDWIGKFDFVYSNSHDHSSDPMQTLKIWSEQIKPKGVVLLEHSRSAHGIRSVSNIDCWGIEPELFPFVLLKSSKADTFVEDIIMIDPMKGRLIFVIKKREKKIF